MHSLEQAIITTRKSSLITFAIVSFLQALNWGKQMVALSGTGPGYKHTVIITPYMHILIHHIPLKLRQHGSFRIFSGQGTTLALY